MSIRYFKCTLLTDIVINASLATEGNMTTLDYIPGSNFLGIVARQLYKETGADQKTYDLFHSGKVSFGDAIICTEAATAVSYPMPFGLMLNKLKKDVVKNTVWVHHLMDYEHEKNKNIQFKQHRTGYFDENGEYFGKVSKNFALKSAYNREERRSDEGRMFGFESINKDQTFIFSVQFEDEVYVNEIVKILTMGRKRIGKSKTAQYGQVEIKEIDNPPKYSNVEASANQLIIYAESNLCLLNKYGQSTLQPELQHFLKEGVEAKGKVRWDLSQIRTYSYSPWNGHRNTSNTQRDCIQKGSVIIIDTDSKIALNELSDLIGEYRAEGLGRVIYNPSFLEATDGIWNIKLKTYKSEEKRLDKSSSNLSDFLMSKQEAKKNELNISKIVLAFIPKSNHSIFEDITSSQWGAIRNEAVTSKDIETLYKKLFDPKKGMLYTGVAATRYWDKNGGQARARLEKEIKGKEVNYTIKLASEMAKWKNSLDRKN